MELLLKVTQRRSQHILCKSTTHVLKAYAPFFEKEDRFSYVQDSFLEKESHFFCVQDHLLEKEGRFFCVQDHLLEKEGRFFCVQDHLLKATPP
ncbi:hypothetical protein [Gracilibacillus alcaliphilus]|uniref:hypothetical protein n=1 Tax=Gracilibacillus alcaliphilus TaxID=1401441 RepID=UPI00195DEC6A|nr:hypothetical protein [Gracilibacillus alcaliphilus]MBM7678177.1 hypothetical protein [Gracilibacillus alcaliphilus]